MKTFLSIEDAAKFLNLKLSRLRYEVFHKRIPFYKIGRSIRFDINELTEWVKSQRGC